MKVAKFGGSSVANGSQINKVAEIVKNDPEIRYVVVSAPGKRSDDDIKVTDMLIALYTNVASGIKPEAAIESILKRYADIIEELDLDEALLKQFEAQLGTYISEIKEPEYLLDALKSCGEDFNAQLISARFNKAGIQCRYMSPLELGIEVSDQPGNAHLVPSSYEKINAHKNPDEVLVIPGFFGYTASKRIVTFSRGGSDITGAIVARGVEAEAYENFTDQSYIYAAHPGIIANPYPVKEITYREMRELAYSGFGIFHAEALTPLYEADIPIVVRNTNAPEMSGTRIVAKRYDVEQLPVIGVSAEEGYLSISISKYLLNQEIGILRRYFEIFERHQISIEHVPTGIDDISVLVRSEQFKSQATLDALVEDIEHIIRPDSLEVSKNLALAVVVGEGMREVVGLAHRATGAFADAGISLRMINQGASELSMFFTIDEKDLQKSIEQLYTYFFTKE